MYTVPCRAIVDNMSESQHSQSHDDCTFNPRLVSKTRKDQRNSQGFCQDEFRPTNLVRSLARVPPQSSPQRRAYLRSPDSSSRPAVGSLKQSPRCDQSMFTLLLVAHCLLLFLFFFSLLPSWSWSIHRAKCPTLPPFQWFRSVLHPSQCSQPIPTSVCSFSVLHIWRRFEFNRCPIILWWSVGSVVSRIPIMQI